MTIAAQGPGSIAPSVVDVIGNTPLVELERITRDINGRILMKLEFLNPGFSKKDRAAVRVIEEAEQFERPGNRNAHYAGTAAEIWAQCDGVVTAFCDFAGSGGTFAGCCRYFKEQDASIRCYIVEPENAAALSGACVSNPDHPIQGGGYAMNTLVQLDGVEPDGYLEVSTEDVLQCTRRLAREEGIFAGYSTGANLAGALALLNGPLPGATIATIACDSGLKYLSTDLWIPPGV